MTEAVIAPGIIPPGSTIGMLGAGQLGRMTALAAARLGYKVHIFAPDATPDSPAVQVAAATTAAGWNDETALGAFAEVVDVVTLEWENVPVSTVAFLASRVTVRPGVKALAVAQSRAAEKSFANRLGIDTAPWRPVSSLDELKAALAAIGPDAIIKTNRMGYDGKGQARLSATSDVAAVWADIAKASGRADGTTGDPIAVLEGLVPFTDEVSVVVARGADGAMAAYPTVRNTHVNGILDRTEAPARLPESVTAKAESVARALAEGLDIVGLLAVEMFVTAAGVVLVNEMAPRPHNSGHWTQDGAVTCQFEQLTRAVCGLPLGAAEAFARVEMRNLIGDDVHVWSETLGARDEKLHLYGKKEARPGRKMGHVNRIIGYLGGR